METETCPICQDGIPYNSGWGEELIEKCYGRLFKHCSLTDEDISLTRHDQETCSNGHTWSE